MSRGVVRRNDKEMMPAKAEELLHRAKLAHFGALAPASQSAHRGARRWASVILIMSRWLALLVTLWASSADASPSDYFVTLTSDLNDPAEVAVLFGKERLGPRPISKNSSTTYGPVPWSVPEHATITWRFAGGPEHSMIVRLGERVPKEFKPGDSLLFRLISESAVATFFAAKVGRFRRVEIPLGESPVDARKRDLNERMLASAGLGKLDTVEQLISEGADPNYLFDTIYASPVRLAANGGHFAVVDFLLRAGAKLTKRDLSVPYLADQANKLRLDAR